MSAVASFADATLRDWPENNARRSFSGKSARMPDLSTVLLMSLGMTEVIVLLVIALLIFGPSRLPGLGKSLGQAIRGFKKGIDEDPIEVEVKSEKLSASAQTEAEVSAQKNKQAKDSVDS